MNVGATADKMIYDYFSAKPKNGVDFKQAIEDYKDEMLTGLTKEEKEAMEAILDKYAAENPGDVEGYQSLRKALLKRFGFKGNIDAGEDTENSAGAEAGDMVSAGVDTGAKPIPRQADIKSTTERVTDSSGDTYLIVKMNNGASFKMKVSESGDDEMDVKKDVQSEMEAYERNILYN